MIPTQLKTKHASVRGNLPTSLLLVLPLLLFYEVGVLFTDIMNGADFITQLLLQQLGLNGFLIVQASLLLSIVGLAFYLKKKQQFNLRLFIPILLESGIFAITMGTFIVFIMVDFLHIDPRLALPASVAKAGIFDRLILSVGAGFHEELVFRLILLGGLAWVLDHVFNFRRILAIFLAFIISAILFSAAHHLGSLAEPITLGAFVFRLIAGLFFGGLYYFRGFAIAVYTHAFYDIYVLLFAS